MKATCPWLNFWHISKHVGHLYKHYCYDLITWHLQHYDKLMLLQLSSWKELGFFIDLALLSCFPNPSKEILRVNEQTLKEITGSTHDSLDCQMQNKWNNVYTKTVSQSMPSYRKAINVIDSGYKMPRCSAIKFGQTYFMRIPVIEF